MNATANHKSVSVPVVRFGAAGSGEGGNDCVAVENPFRIIVNGAEYAAASILPGFEREFAYGFLFTSGLVERAGDILRIELADDFGAAFVKLKECTNAENNLSIFAPLMPGTACGAEPQTLTTAGLSPLESKAKFSSNRVMKLVKSVRLDSPLFKETGAAHTAAVFDESGGLLARADDVGRHNAVDKVAGFLLLKNVAGKAAVIVTTGRLTSEIAAKAWRLKIPVLASPSCATSRAIEIAAFANITLAGFVRGSRMTVYSGYERIYAGEET